MYKVRAEVIKMNGKCTYHKVGDYIEAEDDLLTTPDGRNVYLWSLSALLPFL